MAEIELAWIDIEKLTPSALKVLRATTMHAFKHPNIVTHTFSVEDFFCLTGISATNDIDLASLLINARKALGGLEVIDVDSSNDAWSRYASWQLLHDAEVNHNQVCFEISRHTFDERIRSLLRTNLFEPTGVSHSTARELA